MNKNLILILIVFSFVFIISLVLFNNNSIKIKEELIVDNDHIKELETKESIVYSLCLIDGEYKEVIGDCKR